MAVGKWKVFSQMIEDEKNYIVGRVKDDTKPVHSGNVEYLAGHGYTTDREYCERMTLETNLAQLRSANERLQVDLKAQSSEATQLKKELAALRKELSDLKALSVTQESSLTNANRLLEEYAIEAKRERLRIKAQRNGWAAVAACLVVALAVK